MDGRSASNELDAAVESHHATDEPGAWWCSNARCTNLVITHNGRPVSAADMAAIEEVARQWENVGCGCFGTPESRGSPNGSGDLCQLSILIDFRKGVVAPALFSLTNATSGRIVAVTFVYPEPDESAESDLQAMVLPLISSDCRLNYYWPPDVTGSEPAAN